MLKLQHGGIFPRPFFENFPLPFHTNHITAKEYNMGTTNAQIIFQNSIILMQSGVIKTINGMPEPIHTYQHWQDLGFQVRKGEKAIASFPIWKHVNSKTELSENETIIREKMIMKKSFFFSLSQVDKIGGTK